MLHSNLQILEKKTKNVIENDRWIRAQIIIIQLIIQIWVQRKALNEPWSVIWVIECLLLHKNRLKDHDYDFNFNDGWIALKQIDVEKISKETFLKHQNALVI